MQGIKEGKPFTYRCGGKELAKVLIYYGYIPDVSSSEYKIVCPFHNDLNPSMIVNLEEGTFFCFGCNCSGDAYRFVELMNPKLNTLQVVFKLFEILKSDKVEAIDFSNRKKVNKTKRSKELYDISWDYYFCLKQNDWTVENFEELREVRRYMYKRGFDPETLNKCNARITYNKQYAIIFPMFDNDYFKGWVCRTTLKDVEKRRKYLYNEGFSRATTLVGNYSNCEFVFIVEGYMDRLKFIQYGVTNVVAILGWKMSYEQEKKLKSCGINHVVSALDNDECGKKGTKYLKSIFKKVTRFTYLKGIKDPGEMSKELFDIMYKKTMIKYAQDRRKQ